MDSTRKKNNTQRVFGSSPRSPGGSVPATGRSTSIIVGESSERLVVWLPAGSAADMVTAEGTSDTRDWGVCTTLTSDSQKSTLLGMRNPG